MPGSGTFGGKVGGFVTENFSLDGNLSWYNHMFGLSDRTSSSYSGQLPIQLQELPTLTDNEVKTRALLWEASGNYDFVSLNVGSRFTPYVTLGVGGITARIKNADLVLLPAAASFATRCTSTPVQRCRSSSRIRLL